MSVEQYAGTRYHHPVIIGWDTSPGGVDELPNWYSDSNAFNRYCVPMLREKGLYLMEYQVNVSGDIYCRIVLDEFEDGYKKFSATGPDIPASTALAFIEVFEDE